MVTSRTIRAGLIAFAFLPGCESIADLNVRYTDAGAAEGASDAADGANADAADADRPPPIDGGPVDSLGKCPCDTTAGIGCCIPAGGAAPYCISSFHAASCTSAAGMFVACTEFDAVNDSFCCWHDGTGAGSETAYAAACNAGPMACRKSSDCSAGATCTTVSCGGATDAFTVGVCRAAGPTCP